jgi:hypothetical protein
MENISLPTVHFVFTRMEKVDQEMYLLIHTR